MIGRRPPWKEFKAALDAAGFHPSRKLGQNFLLDENTALAIARDGGVGPGDFTILLIIVVDGPGGIDLGVGPAALKDEAPVALRLRLVGVGRLKVVARGIETFLAPAAISSLGIPSAAITAVTVVFIVMICPFG